MGYPVLVADYGMNVYYGGLYDGNRMAADRTITGDTWKAGYSTNSIGGSANWSADANTQAVTIS